MNTKKIGVVAAFAIASILSGNTERGVTKRPEPTDEQKKKRLSELEIEINKNNGLKEFFYGGNSLWALNQKNADKKARKNKWIDCNNILIK